MKIQDIIKPKYSENDRIAQEDLDKTVRDVVELLMENRLTVATGESLTGGLLSERVTSVPGASNVFELGICTYSDRMKQDLLQVPRPILSEYGAVSRETVFAMAEGLRRVSGADLCLTVSGLAGPGGGTEKTPVGTVYAGFAFRNEVAATLLDFSAMPKADRDAIRHKTAVCVFQLAKQILLS